MNWGDQGDLMSAVHTLMPHELIGGPRCDHADPEASTGGKPRQHLVALPRFW